MMSFILGSIFATTEPAFADLLDQIVQDISQLFQRMSDVESLASQTASDVSSLQDLAGQPPPVTILHFEQSTKEFLSPTEFILLAKWEIVKNDPAFVQELILYDSSVYAKTKGNVNIGWYRSVDGITWQFFEGIISSTVSFEVKREFDSQNTISSSINFIAFAIENPATEGSISEVEDISGAVTIHSPPGQSLTKISLP